MFVIVALLVAAPLALLLVDLFVPLRNQLPAQPAEGSVRAPRS